MLKIKSHVLDTRHSVLRASATDILDALIAGDIVQANEIMYTTRMIKIIVYHGTIKSYPAPHAPNDIYAEIIPTSTPVNIPNREIYEFSKKKDFKIILRIFTE